MRDPEGDIPFDQNPTSEWVAFRIGVNDDHEESSFTLGDEEEIPNNYRDPFLV